MDNLSLYIFKTLKLIGLFVLIVLLSSCQIFSKRDSVKEPVPIYYPPVQTTPSLNKEPIDNYQENKRIILPKPKYPQNNWRKKLQQADRAYKNKNWSTANYLYNEVLDQVDSDTGINISSSEINRIYQNASYANVLIVPAPNSYNRKFTNCDHKLRKEIRGVEIERNLIKIEFKFDSTAFTDEGKQEAQELARCLIEKQSEISNLVLVGHTDKRGNFDYNYWLSVKRAKALKTYLQSQGVNAYVSTEGKGESKPLQNLPSGLSLEQKYQANRRVEIKLK